MPNEKALDARDKDDPIVIGGAGGFMGGSLARYYRDQGFNGIIADTEGEPRYSRTLD